MKVRFQADSDLNEDILTGVVRREPMINFQTASEANLRDLSDLEVVALAAGEDRILITHDRRTMPRHFADLVSKRKSPGVMIVAQRVSINVAIEELLLVWAASDAEEWVNLIVDLPL
jgi:predicted nuclease of predicted toxin-antitoxin system